MKNMMFKAGNSFTLISISFFLLGSCKHDTLPDPIIPNQLISKFMSSAPVIDGNIDGTWADCQILEVTATVPEPGNGVFKGYVGKSYYVRIRSAYDNTNIYFLMEWMDANESLNRQTWYFDPIDVLWKQENKKPELDLYGNPLRQPFYEDKFGVLWNINNSTASFNNQTCVATCHKCIDPETHNGATALHYTNGSNELLDVWHWKSVRTNFYNQMDDKYQDNDEFGANGGRKSDTKTGGGYSNNVQQLLVTGSSDTVSVPKYVIPGLTYYYWVTQEEIDASTAKLITAVDVNGVLTYSGGTIDPNIDVEYQRNGATTGSKCIPSVTIDAFEGGRSDVNSKGVYTGSGWTLEISRPLVTSDANSEDVLFNINEEFPFGIAVFDNASIAHAIKNGLKLKFEK